MKTILIFLTTLFISFSIYAEKLTIYTYDSFVSEWGPGPIIEKIFEEKHNTDVEFVAVDSAATLLNKVILEGDTSKADIVLGLDMNLFDLAEQSGLFSSHNNYTPYLSKNRGNAVTVHGYSTCVPHLRIGQHQTEISGRN